MSNLTITPASAKIKKFEPKPVKAETDEEKEAREYEEFISRAARNGHELSVRIVFDKDLNSNIYLSCTCGEMRTSEKEEDWARHSKKAMRPAVEARPLTQRIQLPKEFVKSLGRK